MTAAQPTPPFFSVVFDTTSSKHFLLIVATLHRVEGRVSPFCFFLFLFLASLPRVLL